MVGVGDGISFEMIRNGAAVGGGEHLIIMDESQLEEQIIYLLESITEPATSNFNLIYNDKIIEEPSEMIPQVLRKGRPIDFYFKFKEPIPEEQL